MVGPEQRDPFLLARSTSTGSSGTPDAIHAQFTPSRIDRKTGRRTRRTRTMHPMEISSPRDAVVVVEFGIAEARFKRKKLKLKL